jgi:LysM repeat protein
LVKRSNNHFGIKCKTEWQGAVVYHDDDEKGECFRSYTNANDSYKDHSDFLRNRPNYAALFSLDPTDYEGWATGLKKAGYATSPAYAQKLIKIIETYQLQQYTFIALERKQEKQKELLAIQRTQQPHSVSTTSSSLAEKKLIHSVSSVQPVSATHSSGIFTLNQTKAVWVKAGTSLFLIANNYHIRYNKLLDFNEGLQQEVLKEDKIIFLERKPKKGSKEIHITNYGETLQDIACSEGIRLKNLTKYNRISPEAKLLAGEKVYLQKTGSKIPKTISTATMAANL